MGDIILAGSTSGSITVAPPAVAGSGTLTLPTGTDTLVGLAATQTLTNKTLTTPNLGTPSTLVLTNATGLAAAAMPAGSVLQVVSTTKTDVFTTSSVIPTFASVTGYSVAITPSSASNKILIQATYTASIDAVTAHSFTKIQRNGTDICIGDAAGSRTRSTNDITLFNVRDPSCYSISVLDSPSSTSAVTYQLMASCQTGFTFALNRDAGNDDNTITGRFASTITAMEIKG